MFKTFQPEHKEMLQKFHLQKCSVKLFEKQIINVKEEIIELHLKVIINIINWMSSSIKEKGGIENNIFIAVFLHNGYIKFMRFTKGKNDVIKKEK